MLVPTIRTICTDDELCRSLIIAWQKLFNVIPSKRSICIVMAQHIIETGNNDCWNWNICNVKYVVANGNVDYCALNGVFEIVNGVRIELPSTNPGAWFRSFSTLDDGVSFYLQFISGKRYQQSWQAVMQGNPSLFAHLLKLQGYYTANETTYTNELVYEFNHFMNTGIFERALAEAQYQINFPPDFTPEDQIPSNKSNVCSWIKSILISIYNIIWKNR